MKSILQSSILQMQIRSAIEANLPHWDVLDNTFFLFDLARIIPPDTKWHGDIFYLAQDILAKSNSFEQFQKIAELEVQKNLPFTDRLSVIAMILAIKGRNLAPETIQIIEGYLFKEERIYKEIKQILSYYEISPETLRQKTISDAKERRSSSAEGSGVLRCHALFAT